MLIVQSMNIVQRRTKVLVVQNSIVSMGMLIVGMQVCQMVQALGVQGRFHLAMMINLRTSLQILMMRKG